MMSNDLSGREREIVLEAAAGLTDKEIAKKLDLSVASVRTYWDRLRRKLEATNKGHAIALALRGIVLEQERTGRERERMVQLIVENTTDYAIFALDLDGRMTTWNIGVERMLGFDEPEFLKLKSEDIFTPEDRENGAAEAEMRTALEFGRADDERWHLRKDGSRFYGSGVMIALRDGNGELQGLGKIVRDYTPVKKLLDSVIGKGITL
jgi:PAS domain S-box-containing protein